MGGARTKNDCFSSVWINVKIRIGGLFAHPQMVRAGEKERLCNFRSSEEHVLAEEGLAGSVERLDGFGCTPAVAFALVEVVFVGDIAAAQGRDDFLGLLRRDDVVVAALKDGYRVAKLVGGIDRRALAVEVAGFGQGAEQRV